MDQEKLLEAINTLRADVVKHCETVVKHCDTIAAKQDKLDGEMKQLKADAAKKRKDDDGEDDTMAERTAADSERLSSDMRVLQSQVKDLIIRSPRALTQADRDAFADAQAKADAVLRVHNDRADQPMRGEQLVEYLIRLHRPMQRHSQKWGKAELATIAADRAVFNNVLAEIRADALQAGLNPPDLPPFQYREIKTESSAGHRISSFVGRGTIFKAMSRPIRFVESIGADDRYPRSAGGFVYAPGA